MSNELLVKPKSSEIAVLVKSAAECEQKTHHFSKQAFYRRIGFSEDDELGGEAARDLPTR